MNRRELLVLLTSSSLGACLPRKRGSSAASSAAPRSHPEVRFLSAFCDVLLPSGETPGAVQAGVPMALAKLMQEWASDATRKEMQAELALLEDALSSDAQRFAERAPAAREQALVRLDAQAFAVARGAGPISKELATAYKGWKWLVIRAFGFSEAGATQTLQYQALPETWSPCEDDATYTREWRD